jgi:hypothetical protein
MRKHFPWFGAGLILIGLALLLERFGVVHVGWGLGLGAVLALFGGFTVVRAFRAGRKQGIYWGAILLGVAGSSVLSDLGILTLEPNIQFPLLVMLLGIGFLLTYVRFPREWIYLIPTGFLIIVGAAIWMSESGWLETWKVRAAISMYWPIALMLLGAAIIMHRKTA